MREISLDRLRTWSLLPIVAHSSTRRVRCIWRPQLSASTSPNWKSVSGRRSCRASADMFGRRQQAGYWSSVRVACWPTRNRR